MSFGNITSGIQSRGSVCCGPPHILLHVWLKRNGNYERMGDNWLIFTCHFVSISTWCLVLDSDLEMKSVLVTRSRLQACLIESWWHSLLWWDRRQKEKIRNCALALLNVNRDMTVWKKMSEKQAEIVVWLEASWCRVQSQNYKSAERKWEFYVHYYPDAVVGVEVVSRALCNISRKLGKG